MLFAQFVIVSKLQCVCKSIGQISCTIGLWPTENVSPLYRHRPDDHKHSQNTAIARAHHGNTTLLKTFQNAEATRGV